ncbi:phosphoserine phosphatase SerB [uncultured Ferrimonas sp.]|uniref:phosphoserine phosphatase SerB n=1 Tax=uncultured Ferrimonas sp. TaxID=432640 RepID=UPI00260323EB|nr:phosphoserine phosphatase SerB [uncultured Ferrimonas sp.]
MSATTTAQGQWQPHLPATALIGQQLAQYQAPALQQLVADHNVLGQLERKIWQGEAPATLPSSNHEAEWVRLPAQLPQLSQPGLLLMDMDSTAIQIECIDEIARRGGCYQQVAAVTEQAMQGQLDFVTALRQRVSLLRGIPATVLTDIAAELPLMPGLIRLCQQLHQQGWVIAIASGGFNAIASVLAAQLQLDYFEANDLEQIDGLLSGELLGGIVDAERKAQILVELGARYRIPAQQWVAVGDGANDLPMLAAAQLGVGFHAKPAVAKQADVAINQLGLDAILALLRP